MSQMPNPEQPTPGSIGDALDPIRQPVEAELASEAHIRAVAGQVISFALPILDPIARAAILAAAGPIAGTAANALLSAGEVGLQTYLASGQAQVSRTDLAAAARGAGTIAAQKLADAGHTTLSVAAEQALGHVATAIGS